MKGRGLANEVGKTDEVLELWQCRILSTPFLQESNSKNILFQHILYCKLFTWQTCKLQIGLDQEGR